MDIFLFTFILLLLIGVFIYDFKYNLIPNWMTGSGIIVGWVYSLSNGFPNFLDSLLGTCIGFAILLLPYMLGGVGGGDVKFLAALGSLSTLSYLMQTALIGFLLAGVFSIIVLFKHGKWTSVKYAFFYIFYRKKLDGLEASKLTIPLGSCISLAGIGLLILQISG